VGQQRVPSSKRSPAPDHPQFEQGPLKEDGRAQKKRDRQEQKTSQDIHGGDFHGAWKILGPQLEERRMKGIAVGVVRGTKVAAVDAQRVD
jgi:hypothetical protein